MYPKPFWHPGAVRLAGQGGAMRVTGSGVPFVGLDARSPFGGSKLGWFRAFTKSARSSKPNRSLNRMLLARDILTTVRRGPRNVFLPFVPNVPGVASV